MKTINIILKAILALPLIVFGLNKLLPNPFIEMPPPEGEVAQLYMQAFFTSYLAKTVAALEVVGALLLFNKKTEKLGLVLLFPISLNILLFHLFHDLAGIAPGLVVFALNSYLLVKSNVYQQLIPAN